MGTPDQLSMSESSDDGASARTSITSADTSSLVPRMERGRYEEYGEWAKYGKYGRYGKHGIYGQYGKYGDYGRYGEYGQDFIKKDRQSKTNDKPPTLDEHSAVTDKKSTPKDGNKSTDENVPGWPYPEVKGDMTSVEKQQPTADKPQESKSRRRSNMKTSAKGQRAAKKKSRYPKQSKYKQTVVTKTYTLPHKPY